MRQRERAKEEVGGRECSRETEIGEESGKREAGRREKCVGGKMI